MNVNGPDVHQVPMNGRIQTNRFEFYNTPQPKMNACNRVLHILGEGSRSTVQESFDGDQKSYCYISP